MFPAILDCDSQADRSGPGAGGGDWVRAKGPLRGGPAMGGG